MSAFDPKRTLAEIISNPFQSGRLNSGFISVFARAPVLLQRQQVTNALAASAIFQLPVAGDMGTIALFRTPGLPCVDEIAVSRALALLTKGQAHDCCERPGKPDQDGDRRYQPRHQ